MADPIFDALKELVDAMLEQFFGADSGLSPRVIKATNEAHRLLVRQQAETTPSAELPAPVPSLPLPARPSMPLLAPLNGWAACVDGNLVAVYSDRDGTPGHLLWSAGGGMKQEGQADG